MADPLRIVAVEEHFLDGEVAAASAPAMNELAPDFIAAFVGTGDFPPPEVAMGLGERRLADMEAAGVAMQVLSFPNAELLPAEVALELVPKVNDKAAAAVGEHPDRFAALAALPTASPEAAATELARCVGELGFVGAIVTGRAGGELLDAPRFEPILATASSLGVPIHLHAAFSPRAVTDASYAGLDPIVTARFQTSAWGWHQETATHFLHLVLSGVFDRHPKLQFVLGHWGEMIPFFLDRIDEAFPQRVSKLERPFADYIRENLYVSPSGMFSQAQLRYCVETLPVERILCSVDYPMPTAQTPAEFLASADLPDEDKRKIAHENAERLFGLASP